ncbi:MAG: T9SS type A sorting domain-containing protein [Flavobacteriales bacterium]|nr:T9SS type A sorting domain-containing protein [Flavobacteriales bacterium]
MEYDADTICLAPGSYTMVATPNDQPTGGAPVFSVAIEGFISGPSQNVSWITPVPMPFDFYLPCADSDNGIATSVSPSGLSAVQQGTSLQLQRIDGQPLGNVELFDVQGRLCFQTSVQANSAAIPVVEFGSGIFMLRAGREVVRVVLAR